MIASLSVLLTAAALHVAGDDPATILKAGAEACRSVQSAKYTASWQLTDANAPRQVEGEVAFLKWPPEADAPPPPATPNADGSMPAIPMTAPRLKTLFSADLRVALSTGEIRTFDHDRAAVFNPIEKSFKVMESGDGGERIMVQDTTVMLLDSPLLQPESIDRVLKMAERMSLGERENVHGVECEVVTARLPKLDANSDVVTSIALGVEDHLPRRTVFEQFSAGRSTMRQTLTISNLQTNVPMASTLFEQEAPEGIETETLKPEPPPQLLANGDDAPAFTLKDANDRTISLSDFKGRIVLVDFWGTWCGPCRMAMPSIQKVHAKYKDQGVVVIGISCREKPDADPAKTMKDLGCDYGLLLHGETIVKDWHVPGYPTLYLIDRDGRIAFSELGYDQELEAKLSEAIDALLKR